MNISLRLVVRKISVMVVVAGHLLREEAVEYGL